MSAAALIEGLRIEESPGEPNLFHATSIGHPTWLFAIRVNGEVHQVLQREAMRLIEQRLNAHDELVAALEELLHNSNPPYSGEAAQDADFERRYKAASDRAIASIAKATRSKS